MLGIHKILKGYSLDYLKVNSCRPCEKQTTCIIDIGIIEKRNNSKCRAKKREEENEVNEKKIKSKIYHVLINIIFFYTLLV